MMRQAFSMFVAIATIVVMTALTALVMSLTGKVVKETTDQYRREQAILYAKSYTELAIMTAGAKSSIKYFTSDIDGTTTEVENGQGYNIRANIRYIGTDNTTGASTIGSTGINYQKSQGNIIIVDVRVRYRDIDVVDTVLASGGDVSTVPWKTYFRRTVQKL